MAAPQNSAPEPMQIGRHWSVLITGATGFIGSNLVDRLLPPLRRYRDALLIALLYAAVAHALLSPIAADSVVPAPSDFKPHLGAIVQARMALEEGQFPPRVAPWQHNGWRYPVFQFYSPLPYTLAALIHKWVTPSNPYVAFKITVWLALVLAGIYMYRLASSLTGSRPAGLLTGAMYMAAPYFVMNILARGAFVEAAAQGILPAVLYYSVRCYAGPGLRRCVPAAVCWCALALTHTITWLFTCLFVGLWFLVLGGRPRKILGRLIRLGAAYGFACLLALYFLAPVASVDYLQIRTNLLDPYRYNWYTPLPALLSPSSVAPEPQPGRSGGRDLHPAVGWPMLFAWGVMFHALCTRPGLLRRRAAGRFVPGLLGVFGLALFMTWSPIDFWAYLPNFLSIPQMTYRILTQVMWPGALLGAYALITVFGRRLDARHVIVGLFLIGMGVSSYLPTAESSSTDINLLTQQPDMGYGKDDYLMREDRVPTTAASGEIELPFLSSDGRLVTERGLALPDLTEFRSSPITLHVAGDIPPESAQKPVHLSALLNDRKIASGEFGAGPFEWNVPLKEPLNALKRGRDVRAAQLKLVSDISRPGESEKRDLSPEESPLPAVRGRSVVLRGLPAEQTALPVRRTQQSCGQRGSETFCSLSVPPETGLVQLPVLFYPELLDVRVDGEAAPFLPLVDRTYALVGLRLPPGRHEISIRFEGLGWANRVSAVAWLGLAIVVASFLPLPAFRRRVRQRRRANAFS